MGFIFGVGVVSIIFGISRVLGLLRSLFYFFISPTPKFKDYGKWAGKINKNFALH